MSTPRRWAGHDGASTGLTAAGAAQAEAAIEAADARRSHLRARRPTPLVPLASDRRSHDPPGPSPSGGRGAPAAEPVPIALRRRVRRRAASLPAAAGSGTRCRSWRQLPVFDGRCWQCSAAARHRCGAGWGSTTTGASTPTPTTTRSSPCSADAAAGCATPSNTCRVSSASTTSPGAGYSSTVADRKVSCHGHLPVRGN